MRIFEKLNEYKTKMNSLLLHGNTKTCSRVGFEILERERVTSLLISQRSDRQFSTEQEAKRKMHDTKMKENKKRKIFVQEIRRKIFRRIVLGDCPTIHVGGAHELFRRVIQ